MIGTTPLRIISLRSDKSSNETFEISLRNAGHKVTVLSSTEPAFALVSSSWPDVVVFDPISQFGMSGSVQRLRTNFDGVIVAAGYIPDPTISAMLEELDIEKFAATASDLMAILKNVTGRIAGPSPHTVDQVTATPEQVPSEPEEERQLELSTIDTSASQEYEAKSKTNSPSFSKLLKLKRPNISLPLKRWHRAAIGVAIVAAVTVAVALPFFNPNINDTPQQPQAKALPIVPHLLTHPLAPLTIEELSGETLPLEIAGIKDQEVIEKPAVAFWGDTAPDAFVTVNGEPVEVSEYGAFVYDFPLEDGANYIEVLATDFQGRTTRKTFTVVSLQ